MAGDASNKTESGLLFESYLVANSYCDFEFEPEGLGGQSKRPDYLVRSQGQELLFEVKELCAGQQERQTTMGDGIEYGDPYKGLREEIEQARRKFRRLKDWCCSLVVRRVDDWQTMLDPPFVFAAMMGDIAFVGQWDPTTGAVAPGTTHAAFTKGGKMRRDKTGRPQNTTISSIAVLGKWQGMTPRVRVFENPNARIPLPCHVPSGPFDERWALRHGGATRVFVGDALREIEEAD